MQTLEKNALFWDIAKPELDPRVHQRFIIERILGRGDIDDLAWAKTHYGEDALKQVFLSAKSLDKRSVVFFEHYFNIDPTLCTNKPSLEKREPFWTR